MPLQVEEEVRAPQGDAVNQHHSAADVVSAQLFFFFQIGPFRTAGFLMADNPLAELFVPYAGRGHVNGIGRKAQSQLFGIRTFSGTCSSGDEYDSFHAMVCFQNAHSVSSSTVPAQRRGGPNQPAAKLLLLFGNAAVFIPFFLRKFAR